MAKLAKGDRISNYLLDEPLGIGSFGEVWRARHHMFDDMVAIKVPTDPDFVRNLQREGVAIHGLRHPNIVRAIDLDPYADPPYLVMEYVEGPSLREAIDEYKREFPVAAAVTIMRGILQALQAAHDGGLVHRDVKPANLLLNHPLAKLASITERAIRVTDFGLGHAGGVTTASLMQSGSLTTGDGRSIAGTLAYMSPEQKDGRNVDGRSDLYACGIILFEMLVGERPQGTDLPSTLRTEIPRELDEVFRRSYTRWERRYGSAREMLDALRPEPTTAAPEPPPAPVQWPQVDGGLSCPGCRTPVHRDDQFCIKCGRQLVASVPRCPNQECHAFVHLRDKFCVFCGADLQVLNG